MKAAVIHDYCDIRVEEMAVPEIGPGEVLVKAAVCGICSGDLMDWYIRKKAGTVLGHEPAGTVVDVGEGIEGIAVGDRVFAHHHAPCGGCEYCATGQHVQCETWPQAGIFPGGMAQYFRVGADVVKNDMLKLPPSLSFDAGAFIEPLGCVVKGFSRVPKHCKSGTVVVMGLGVMGMLNIVAARAFGAKMIIASDLDGFRAEKAAIFGADYSVDASCQSLDEKVADWTGGKMADLVVVGPASLSAMQQGIDLAGRAGTVLLFSPAGPGKKLSIDIDSLYFRDINLITSYSCGPEDTRAALDLLEKGAINTADLISHRFPLEKVNEGYCLAAKGGKTLKVMIEIETSA